MHTKYFYISIIVFICTYILNGLVLATHVYYTRDVLGNADLYSIIAVISVIATIIGISIAPKLKAKMGKQKTLILSSVVYIAGCVVGIAGATKVGTGLAAAALGWGLEMGGYNGALAVQAATVPYTTKLVIFEKTG